MRRIGIACLAVGCTLYMSLVVDPLMGLGIALMIIGVTCLANTPGA